jgi:hypothetical protein
MDTAITLPYGDGNPASFSDGRVADARKSLFDAGVRDAIDTAAELPRVMMKISGR